MRVLLISLFCCAIPASLSSKKGEPTLTHPCAIAMTDGYDARARRWERKPLCTICPFRITAPTLEQLSGSMSRQSVPSVGEPRRGIVWGNRLDGEANRFLERLLGARPQSA